MGFKLYTICRLPYYNITKYILFFFFPLLSFCHIKAVIEGCKKDWRGPHCVGLLNGKDSAFPQASHAARHDDCLSQLSDNQSGKSITHNSTIYKEL